jgi:hypothetical protein
MYTPSHVLCTIQYISFSPQIKFIFLSLSYGHVEGGNLYVLANALQHLHSMIITMNVTARYVMVRGVQHHYEGHWKGWALKNKTCLGPEMGKSKANAIWAQKS